MKKLTMFLASMPISLMLVGPMGCRGVDSSSRAAATDSGIDGAIAAADSAEVERIAAANLRTKDPYGNDGDAVNLALIGAKEDITQAFLHAGWLPPDPVTYMSSIKIAKAVILNSPYPTAPMSSLQLFGRVQDLAFEKEVNGSPRTRHHIRLWQSGTLSSEEQKPIWLAAATFDMSVGVTKEGRRHFTHHISPDIDLERDTVGNDLTLGGSVVNTGLVAGVDPRGPLITGSGDPFHTDGQMRVLELSAPP